MAAPELQTVALSVGDLNWIVATLGGGALVVAGAVWWLAVQFRELRAAIGELQTAMATSSAEAAGDAKHTDTRLGQHSERMSALEARVGDLERWRIKHIEEGKK